MTTIANEWTDYAPVVSPDSAYKFDYPVDPRVIDSPACAMPQYAGYATKFFFVGASAYPATSGDTYEEVLDKANTYGTHHEGYRIVRVPVTHEGLVVGRRQSYGVWAGQCGSHIWYTDPDRYYQRTFKVLVGLGHKGYIQSGYLDSHVRRTQAWWINGVSDRHPEQDGFWVECPKKTSGGRHEGLCGDDMFAWDWRDYCPWTDQGHYVEPTLF